MSECKHEWIWEEETVATEAHYKCKLCGTPKDVAELEQLRQQIQQLQSDLAQREAECAEYRFVLKAIAALANDYNVYGDAKSLMELIDELRNIASQTLSSTSSGKDMLELVERVRKILPISIDDARPSEIVYMPAGELQWLKEALARVKGGA